MGYSKRFNIGAFGAHYTSIIIRNPQDSTGTRYLCRRRFRVAGSLQSTKKP